MPDTLVSSDSRMWLQYYSFASESKHLGFSAEYEGMGKMDFKMHLVLMNSVSQYGAGKFHNTELMNKNFL